MHLVLLLAGALLAQTGEATPPASRVDALVVPIVSFNSDVGVGLGLAGSAYFYDGKPPYAHALTAQVFFTTRGVQSHYLQYDAPHLLGPLRLEVHAELNRELDAPYFGPGNAALGTADPDPADKRYAFKTTYPIAWVRLRFPSLSRDHPFTPYVGYRLRWTQVTPYAGSLLLEQHPLGMGGGRTGELMVGLLNDTRDDQNDTTQGGLEELSVRIAARPFASQYGFVGATLSERRFFRLFTPRLILGERIAVDALFGDVPFFEWTRFGGLADNEGVGGMNSVRGIARNRYSGAFKLFSNTELRVYPAVVRIFGVDTKLGGLAFFDVGSAWQPGVDNGPATLFHPTIGLGLRIARREAVLRVDYAVAVGQAHHGIYVAFGQLF